MQIKDLTEKIFSRKASIAAIGIIALCYIATITNAQLAVDEQSVISIVPMPKVPAVERPLDWKISAEITLITCLAIFIQGLLDYFRPRKKSNIENAENAEVNN